MTSSPSLPLSQIPTGGQGTILALEGGAGFCGRLAALGFTPGADVQVVRNPGRGPVIISVMDTQIALGRGQADRVLVRVKEG